MTNVNRPVLIISQNTQVWNHCRYWGRVGSRTPQLGNITIKWFIQFLYIKVIYILFFIVYAIALYLKCVYQFSSVTQSCPTLCDPMDCSTPGFAVHHQLLELAQTCPSSWWCHPTISSSVVPFSSCLQSFPESASFQISQFFAPGGRSIGVSASTSVLPMNIQDWPPLGWTGWISLQSKRLSVFSNTTVQKHQFFGILLSL